MGRQVSSLRRCAGQCGPLRSWRNIRSEDQIESTNIPDQPWNPKTQGFPCSITNVILAEFEVWQPNPPLGSFKYSSHNWFLGELGQFLPKGRCARRHGEREESTLLLKVEETEQHRQRKWQRMWWHQRRGSSPERPEAETGMFHFVQSTFIRAKVKEKERMERKCWNIDSLIRHGLIMYSPSLKNRKQKKGKK